MIRSLLFIGLLILGGCSSSKIEVDVTEFNESNPVIEMSKTACFGKCPVYTLQIKGDGEVLLVGKENLDKIGKYTLKIDDTEIAGLVKLFEEAGFWNMKDKYDGRVTDLPSTFISFSYNGKFKKIKSRYNAPEELNRIEETLAEYLKRFGWIKVEEGHALPLRN